MQHKATQSLSEDMTQGDDMKFQLKELKHGLKNQFTPQESIVDYIRCKNCNSRETSNLSVGLSVRGLQIWCDNCDHNVLHLQLTGTILTDPHRHGKFNERTKANPKEEHKNNFTIDLDSLGCITSDDLVNKRIEELEEPLSL